MLVIFIGILKVWYNSMTKEGWGGVLVENQIFGLMNVLMYLG